MPSFGSYESVGDRWLRTISDGLVWRVRPRSGPVGARELYAITCQSLAFWHKQKTDEFLASAELQKRLAGEQPACWATVEETGRCERVLTFREGTFCITRSRGELLDHVMARGAPAEPVLRATALTVLRGCRQLVERRGYGHGRLSAEHIWIEPQPAGPSAGVRLRNPAPDSAASATRSASSDAVRLGQILTRWVQQDRGEADVELMPPQSKPWARLGPHGTLWWHYCKSLLHTPEQHDAELLAEVEAAIVGFRVPAEATIAPTRRTEVRPAENPVSGPPRPSLLKGIDGAGTIREPKSIPAPQRGHDEVPAEQEHGDEETPAALSESETAVPPDLAAGAARDSVDAVHDEALETDLEEEISTPGLGELPLAVLLSGVEPSAPGPDEVEARADKAIAEVEVTGATTGPSGPDSLDADREEAGGLVEKPGPVASVATSATVAGEDLAAGIAAGTDPSREVVASNGAEGEPVPAEADGLTSPVPADNTPVNEDVARTDEAGPVMVALTEPEHAAEAPRQATEAGPAMNNDIVEEAETGGDDRTDAKSGPGPVEGARDEAESKPANDDAQDWPGDLIGEESAAEPVERVEREGRAISSPTISESAPHPATNVAEGEKVAKELPRRQTELARRDGRRGARKVLIATVVGLVTVCGVGLAVKFVDEKDGPNKTGPSPIPEPRLTPGPVDPPPPNGRTQRQYEDELLAATWKAEGTTSTGIEGLDKKLTEDVKLTFEEMKGQYESERSRQDKLIDEMKRYSDRISAIASLAKVVHHAIEIGIAADELVPEEKKTLLQLVERLNNEALISTEHLFLVHPDAAELLRTAVLTESGSADSKTVAIQDIKKSQSLSLRRTQWKSWKVKPPSPSDAADLNTALQWVGWTKAFDEAFSTSGTYESWAEKEKEWLVEQVKTARNTVRDKLITSAESGSIERATLFFKNTELQEFSFNDDDERVLDALRSALEEPAKDPVKDDRIHALMQYAQLCGVDQVSWNNQQELVSQVARHYAIRALDDGLNLPGEWQGEDWQQLRNRALQVLTPSVPELCSDAVEQQLRPVREALSAIQEPDSPQPLSTAPVGPENVGWEKKTREDGVLVFTPPVGIVTEAKRLANGAGSEIGERDLELRFRQVRDQAFYLLENEVPIVLALAVVQSEKEDSKQFWDKVKPPDSEAFVTSWYVSGQSLSPFFRKAGMEGRMVGWLWETATGSATPMLHPVNIKEGPTPMSPAQQVTAAMAACVAWKLGCRLPTQSEFDSAVNVVFPARANRWDGAQENWRDKTFEDCLAYWRVTDDTWSNSTLANKWEQRPDWKSPSASTEPVAGSDGFVWFRPVNHRLNASPAFKDLLGNVAEFVTEDPVDPPPSTSLKGLIEHYESNLPLEKIKIAGWSALCAPAPDADDSVEPYKKLERYKDVGFRLAFSAPSGAAVAAAAPGPTPDDVVKILQDARSKLAGSRAETSPSEGPGP